MRSSRVAAVPVDAPALGSAAVRAPSPVTQSSEIKSQSDDEPDPQCSSHDAADPPGVSHDAADDDAANTGTRKRVACDCSLPAETFWALKDDFKYAEYVAVKSDPPSNPSIVSRTQVDGWVTQTTKLTAIKNPVPYLLRGTLGCKNGFAVEITERWRPDAYDANQRSTFSSKLPFFTDRLSMVGSQWVEPLATGCRIFTEIEVKCTVSGAGAIVAKLLGDKSLKAFREQNEHAAQWVAMQREAAPISRRSSHAQSDERRTDTSDGTAATAMEPASSLRARLRWRMALMYTRFARVLEQQQHEEHRLCDACVDDPRTDGFAPKRFTSYRVMSRVRADSDRETSWITCRKRFSDFLALRDELLAFLPGVELPPLPEKHVSGRLSAAVVDTRRATLQAFLQGALNHPIVATSDALATFLAWPDSVRAPVFGRAQTAYQTPVSAQRKAHERVWRLRRQAMSGRDRACSGTPRRRSSHGAGSPDFSDAMADALMQTVERAASVVQRHHRSRSTLRDSRLTEDDEPVPQLSRAASGRAASGVAHVLPPTPSSCSASTPREPHMAALPASDAMDDGRQWSVSGSGTRRLEPASMTSGAEMHAQLGTLLLQRLEDIDARLQQMEKARRHSWLWDSFLGCGR